MHPSQAHLARDTRPEDVFLSKSVEQPHFVFHLSKRLFSEVAITKKLYSVHARSLNIFSSEYVDEAVELIKKHNKLPISHSGESDTQTPQVAAKRAGRLETCL